MPRTTTKNGSPIIGLEPVSLIIILGISPEVPISLRIFFRAARLLKPFVLIRSMVDNEIHEKFDLITPQLVDEPLHIIQCPIWRVDIAVI